MWQQLGKDIRKIQALADTEFSKGANVQETREKTFLVMETICVSMLL